MTEKFNEIRDNHPDVHVRLMSDFLADAVKFLEQGDVTNAASCVRIAYSCEQRIDRKLRFAKIKMETA